MCIVLNDFVCDYGTITRLFDLNDVSMRIRHHFEHTAHNLSIALRKEEHDE